MRSCEGIPEIIVGIVSSLHAPEAELACISPHATQPPISHAGHRISSTASRPPHRYIHTCMDGWRQRCVRVLHCIGSSRRPNARDDGLEGRVGRWAKWSAGAPCARRSQGPVSTAPSRLGSCSIGSRPRTLHVRRRPTEARERERGPPCCVCVCLHRRASATSRKMERRNATKGGFGILEGPCQAGI